jgi:hypothetical protein
MRVRPKVRSISPHVARRMKLEMLSPVRSHAWTIKPRMRDGTQNWSKRVSSPSLLNRLGL